MLQFNSGTEVLAHYVNLRKRTDKWRLPAPKQAAEKKVEPAPKPETKPEPEPTVVAESPPLAGKDVQDAAQGDQPECQSSPAEPPEPPRPSITLIKRIVGAHFDVTETDLISERRTANLVRPRQMAMYLCKTMTLRSLPEIGRRFGHRDHTTVLHAVRKLERLVAEDMDVAETVLALKHRINNATQQARMTIAVPS